MKKMRCKEQTGIPAFTFVEVLAAMVFLAIVIPVAVHGLTVAHRAGVVAERKAIAARLADSLLAETCLTDAWRDDESEGDFEEPWKGYQWTLEESSCDQEGMLALTVEVRFEVQAREHRVQLSTLVPELQEQPE